MKKKHRAPAASPKREKFPARRAYTSQFCSPPQICTSSAGIYGAARCLRNFPGVLEAITTRASSFSAAAARGGSCLLSRADVYLTRHADFFITFSLLRFTVLRFYSSTLLRFLHFYVSTFLRFQLCLVRTASSWSDIEPIFAACKAAPCRHFHYSSPL